MTNLMWQRIFGRPGDVERVFVRPLWRVLPRFGQLASFRPTLEVVDRNDGHVLMVDLPGLRKEDLDIRVDDNNILTISGERRRSAANAPHRRAYSERRYGSFSRSIELPRGVDPSKIDASFHDGVLEVHVPRNESGRARGVPIESREIGVRDGSRSDGSRPAQVVSS